MFRPLGKISISGASVLPLIEGGKGISISNGVSAGAWAKAGGVGTFSGVNADYYDEEGRLVPLIYKGTTRKERHFELIDHAIAGGIAQAKSAYEGSCRNGRIHMNVLWEMAGTEDVLKGVLKQASKFIHGITCGAGMPYRLAEIASHFGVFYYPIVSSARAFRALWKRAYHKFSQWMGAVVYEDPWLAGGHNGLSNVEDPNRPEDPYPRVKSLRASMAEVGLKELPIIMAGGVWCLEDWKDWIDNPEIGPIAFQLGTRPLLTQESPIPEAWKKKLTTLKKGDVRLTRYSPTGFYSSAVRNEFLAELEDRSSRQIPYKEKIDGHFTHGLVVEPVRRRKVYIREEDVLTVEEWQSQGFFVPLRTPADTLIFITPEKAASIRQDQVDCMGCLSACQFSNWSQRAPWTTGNRPDPRSFCIQKTLQSISHGGPIEKELMFSGHNVYRFSTDPLYADGYIPTVQELIDCLVAGK
jgi:NAD(P)H-dependent flavin oxidoreductase YrpB (nitropropane dioxygenase family)